METWYLVLAFFFVLANGFFVAAEFALVKVRSTQITELAEQGSVRAKMAKKLIRHLDAYLSATQLGITLASLALGWIGEPAFHHLIQPLFTRFQVSETAAKSISATVAFVIISILHIV
ncbi:MAG: CNNM domain-containing protein, partial [Thermoanaerobaculia bacterium]